jgi:predicted Rossmann-fold nucleotide-binding protein
MRLLVCGGRDYKNKELLFKALKDANEKYGITLIIQGGAPGADALAKAWAMVNKVQQKEFKADWNSHGKAAGPIRNRLMLTEGNPDLVYAFAGGIGTANMIAQAKAAGLKVEAFA